MIVKNNFTGSVGGGINADASVSRNLTLTIQDTTVTGNGVFCVEGCGDFAGLYSTLPTTIKKSTFSNNDGGTGTGGIGIFGYDSLIEDSTIDGNTGTGVLNSYAFQQEGPALYGTMTISRSTISNNTSTDTEAFESGSGVGGVAVESPVIISNSTITGNTGYGSGGILNLDINFAKPGRTTSLNTAKLLDVANRAGQPISTHYTISNKIGSASKANNTIADYASYRSSGALYQVQGPQLTITNSTIANNTALAILPPPGSPNKVADPSNGGGVYNENSMSIGSSIFAANTATSGVGDEIFSSGQNATATSLGYNVVKGTTQGVSFIGTDQTSADPQLAALADNGGPTKTQAITSASVAFTKGNCTTLTKIDPVTTDQRGNARKSPSCDAGAFEADQPPTATPTNTPTATPTASPTPTATTTATNTATATGLPNASDPVIVKLVDIALIRPGETAKFSIQVSNPTSNTSPVYAAYVTDPMPAFLEVLSATSSRGTFTINGQTVGFAIGNLNPGEEANMTITTRARQDATVPQSAVNVATVGYNGGARSASAPIRLTSGTLPATGEHPDDTFPYGPVLFVALVAVGVGTVVTVRRKRIS
jgi:hypothetical protein